jgi:hypothetical protein
MYFLLFQNIAYFLGFSADFTKYSFVWKLKAFSYVLRKLIEII